MIRFEFHDSLDDTTIEELWTQDVCMDDWDYVLFVSRPYEDEFEDDDDDEERNTMRPRNYYLDSLLRGACFNKWYRVKDFMGKRGILGVAYHS